MDAKGQYELVLLLTHLDPGLLRLAVTEANGGHMPVGIEGVGIVAFCEACAQCVRLGTAPAGQLWAFAGRRQEQLRSRDPAAHEASEVELALRWLAEWRTAIASHLAAAEIPAATSAALRQAALQAVEVSRPRLAAMLDGLPLAATPDFQAWDVLAILGGRALRGELRDGYSHVPLSAGLTRDLQSQYLSANAARDAVWREAWRRQAALLELPPGWGGEGPDQPAPPAPDPGEVVAPAVADAAPASARAGQTAPRSKPRKEPPKG
jgi:hypothetical protein